MRRFMKKTIIALLVLSLGIVAVLMAYRICGAAGDRDLSGEWTAQLDMSGQAAAMAYGWRFPSPWRRWRRACEI